MVFVRTDFHSVVSEQLKQAFCFYFKLTYNFFGAFINSVRCIVICITGKVNVVNNEEQVTKRYVK